MADPTPLNRNQIAAFVGNDPEAIRAIERLFIVAGTLTPAEIARLTQLILDNSYATGAADNKAEVAISEALAAARLVLDAAYAASAADNKAEVALAGATAAERLADLIGKGPLSDAHNSVSTDYLDLNINAPVPADKPGRAYWNRDDGTMDVDLYGGSVLQVGQEIHFYAKNTSGSLIAKGTPVMFTGAVGSSGKLTFGLAVADGSVLSDYMMGVTDQDIADNGFGYVTSFGLVRGFDTTGSPYGEVWADGDLLYFDPATPGTWTNVQPSAPNIDVPVAVVVNAGSGGSGSIFVRMKISESLNNLQDVYINGTGTPLAGQVLIYDAAQARWENHHITPGANISITNGNGSISIAVSGLGSMAFQNSNSVSITGGTINGSMSVGGTWTAAATWTLPAFTLAGTVTSNNQSFSGTIANLGTVTTVDINGGTIDGTVIGGSSAAAATFTTVTASGDVSIADKIVHTGDTNTAIRFPANDTVTVETDNVERMRITNIGRVGLGVTNPALRFQVAALSSSASTVIAATETNYLADFRSSQLGYHPVDTTGTTLGFSNSNLGSLAFFNTANAVIGTNGATPLAFATTSLERMRITGAGLVGIGTSSPAARFHVSPNSSGASVIAGVTMAGFFEATGNASVQISSGTGSPAYLFLGDAADPDAGRISAQDGFLQIAASGASDFLQFTTGGFAERMRITSAGNVGIGTASPAYKLDVQGTGDTYIRVKANSSGTGADDDAILILDAAETGEARIEFSLSGVTKAAVEYFDGDPALNIGTAAGSGAHIDLQPQDNLAMRITSAGSVLVGDTTARATVNSTGTTAATPAIQLSGTSESTSGFGLFNYSATTASDPAVIFNKSLNATIGSHTAVTSGTQLGGIGFNGSDGTAFAGGAYILASADGTVASGSVPGRLVFATTPVAGTSPDERMRITAAGNVGIGNTAPVVPLHVTGATMATGVIYRAQPAQTSKAAAATLTIAELLTGIIQYTGAAATLTLPTGTDIEGGLPATFPTNMSFDVSVINTGSGTATIAANGNTTVGALTVAAAASGLFRFRKTAANTYTVYRIS